MHIQRMNAGDIGITSLSKTRIFWINAIIFLNFFPFFKILPIDAEIQPFASAIAIVYLIFDSSKDRLKIYVKAVPYILIIFVYFLAALVFNATNSLEFSYVVQSLSILLAPLVVFLVLFDRMKHLSVNLFRWSFYGWFTIQLFQLLIPSFLNASGITLLLSTIIARFEASAHGNGRGLAGFAPEPSYAAHVILLLFAYAILLFKLQKISSREFFTMLWMSVFMVVSNQSTTMGSFATMFAGAYGIWEILQGGNNKSKFIIGFILFTLIGTLGVILFPQALLEIRFFSVFFDIINLMSSGKSKGFNAADFSESYGSVRSIGVQFGYETLFLTNGTGLGIGGYGPYSVPLSKISNAGKASEILFSYGDASPIRPYAYAAFAAMEMGFAGLLSLTVMFLGLIQLSLKKIRKVSPYSFACFALFVFGVYYNQPGSLPAHWLLLLLAFEDG
jgi:hypothetical protein